MLFRGVSHLLIPSIVEVTKNISICSTHGLQVWTECLHSVVKDCLVTPIRITHSLWRTRQWIAWAQPDTLITIAGQVTERNSRNTWWKTRVNTHAIWEGDNFVERELLTVMFLQFWSLILLYAGPDQLLPIASVIGSIIGILLIFWQRLVGAMRNAYSLVMQ